MHPGGWLVTPAGIGSGGGDAQETTDRRGGGRREQAHEGLPPEGGPRDGAQVLVLHGLEWGPHDGQDSDPGERLSALAPPVRGEVVERRRGSVLLAFLGDVLNEVTTRAPLTNCGWRYLPLVMLCGGYVYSVQLRGGLNLGRVPTYSPTWVALTVSAGLWPLGAFVFPVLAKATIAIEVGRSRWRAEPGSPGSRLPTERS
jgi:hypothetical protein